MQGLKDLAETVSEKNENEMLWLDLVETENVNCFLFRAKITRRALLLLLQLLLLLLFYWLCCTSFASLSPSHQGESKLCSLFCSLCTSVCTHHTNTQSAPLAPAKARIPRKCMPLSQCRHLPPLLLISLTSHSCTPLLDHSTPLPTPDSRNSHHAGTR